MCEGSGLLGPGEAECHLDPRTVVGGFDTEADEFSDFDRLRTALPASGSSTGEPPPRPRWAALLSHPSVFRDEHVSFDVMAGFEGKAAKVVRGVPSLAPQVLLGL